MVPENCDERLYIRVLGVEPPGEGETRRFINEL
jgi:hypothetical protein